MTGKQKVREPQAWVERLQSAIRDADALLSRLRVNTYGSFLGRTEKEALNFARESLPTLLRAAKLQLALEEAAARDDSSSCTGDPANCPENEGYCRCLAARGGNAP